MRVATMPRLGGSAALISIPPSAPSPRTPPPTSDSFACDCSCTLLEEDVNRPAHTSNPGIPFAGDDACSFVSVIPRPETSGSTGPRTPFTVLDSRVALPSSLPSAAAASLVSLLFEGGGNSREAATLSTESEEGEGRVRECAEVGCWVDLLIAGRCNSLIQGEETSCALALGSTPGAFPPCSHPPPIFPPTSPATAPGDESWAVSAPLTIALNTIL